MFVISALLTFKKTIYTTTEWSQIYRKKKNQTPQALHVDSDISNVDRVLWYIV